MSINLINLKHISAKDFLFLDKIKNIKKCFVIDLFTQGLEIYEVIGSVECRNDTFFTTWRNLCRK